MRRYTDSERRRAVRDFERSGASAAEFCRRRGMSIASLSLWRQRYSNVRPGAPAADLPWLPVVVEDAGLPRAQAAVVYVICIGSCRLEVPGGFSRDEVADLCRILSINDPRHAAGPQS